MTAQILEFIQNHWILCSATILIIIMIIVEETKGRFSSASNLSARDITLLLNREDATIIDIRSTNTFKDGHIISSINMPPGDLDKHLKKLEANKDKAIVLIDNNGGKTSAIANKLKSHGFTKVYSLAGGIAAWKEAQLPISKI